MTREQYAQDKNRASYWWEARKDGIVVAVEYSPDGTENPLRTLPSPPYEFHAMAYRPGEFANYFWEIESGMEPIWLHSVTRGISPGGMTESYEALLFGRRFPDNREEVMVVLWDGTSHGFTSIRDALAALN